jgi:hypothetical protein
MGKIKKGGRFFPREDSDYGVIECERIDEFTSEVLKDFISSSAGA